MRRFLVNVNSWTISATIIILLLFLPNLAIVSGMFSPSNENWEHIKEFVLYKYLQTSIILVSVTAILTILIGLSLAWLIAQYQFPLRNFLKWALILPLSIPPFIGAYTYHGIVNYTGVIQKTLRNQFEIAVNPAYFDIMNIPGAIFIYTLFLYPYVYTITRIFLSQQSASLIESARMMGRGPWQIFYKVVLPISRVSIIGGASLVVLEVLNDYGVVKYYGIQTFSTAIFQTWFGLGDIESSIKLAASLMGLVIFILVIEKLLRGKKQYSFSTTKIRPLPLVRLKGAKAAWATVYGMFIFSLGFLIPVIQLIDWLILTWGKIPAYDFLTHVKNSVMVAGISSILIILFALIVGNFGRLVHGRIAKTLPKLTILGYSIPGAVIAVAVVTAFIAIDKSLAPLYNLMGISTTLLLSVSLVMLISAYIIRFFAIGYNSIESGYDKIGTDFRDASRLLGMGLTKTFFKVDIPMMKGAIISGFILVFIDILKEIPLTLILRPFNFETLSTKAFQYASDEKIMEASHASLLIVGISALAIFVFHKLLEKEPQ
ncbi:ABC transporter permease [Lederbergia citrea]|uniref:Iron ABC transporter permease n=1 Tax=Lederbergia citrea TaxID=2833581 RepID=A0A942Z5K6_9BACI|nr:iron ABC transporter permease [Lederbergia citrea]MBS4178035.1 iron ABC transporter permease [Lederbergia citrea]MBS4204701.1 iron ABC transporter permease [Lederbergia citrea]MBS4223452.1 iron ABC transporter permease [Lederbergia citrea]